VGLRAGHLSYSDKRPTRRGRPEHGGRINLWGVIHGVKAFLPLLKQRPVGHIVNISSVNAFIPFLASGSYNISKYAVAGLSETLMQELIDTKVSVTCDLHRKGHTALLDAHWLGDARSCREWAAFA